MWLVTVAIMSSIPEQKAKPAIQNEEEKKLDLKQQRDARNRVRAVDELISSEQTYVDRLLKLNDLYIQPLSKEKNHILSTEYHSKLFPPVLVNILKLNQVLLST